MMPIPFRRAAALLLGAGLAAILLPGLALAHSDLVSVTPDQGAVVASPFPGPIVLTFSEHLADGSKADLVDAAGAIVASAVVDATKMTMTITPTTPLSPGAFEVRWVSIADDGDLLRQPVVIFTVAAAASPTAAASPSAATTVAPSTGPSVAPSIPASPIPSSPGPAPSAGSDTSGNGGDVLVPIIVALIILGAGAAYLLSRRNRSPTAT